jgi:hypothetical protein
MKEVIIFIIGVLAVVMLVFITISGDIQRSREIHNESIHAPMSNGGAPGYTTIVIDSCEYIEAISRLAHKDNCKFCAERHRRELKEIVELLND